MKGAPYLSCCVDVASGSGCDGVVDGVVVCSEDAARVNMITLCLPVARIACVMDLPRVGEVPPASATFTIVPGVVDRLVLGCCKKIEFT